MKHYFFILSLFIFTSCQKGNDDSFADSLGGSHSTEYEVVKQNTLQEGFVVLKDKKTGVYTAYDLTGYNSSMKGNEFEAFLNSLPPEGKVTNLNKGLEEVTQTVTEWVDTSHYGYEWVYDEGSGSYVESQVWIEEGYWDTYDRLVKVTVYKADNGLMFEEGTAVGKDLEKWGAIFEKAYEDDLRSTLVNQFGFSEKRSTEVSKIIINIKKLKERRSLSKEDLKRLSFSLFGVSFSLLKKSYIDGSKEEKSDLISRVAKFNETDPESIKNILRLAFSVPR